MPETEWHRDGTGKGLEVGYARGPRGRLLINSCDVATEIMLRLVAYLRKEERNSNLDELRGLVQELSTQK